MNLSTWPPWAWTIGTIVGEQRVERLDDLRGLGALGERREVARVAEQDRRLDLHPALREAAVEDQPGDVVIQVGPERLADPLALGQAVGHRLKSAVSSPSSSLVTTGRRTE